MVNKRVQQIWRHTKVWLVKRSLVYPLTLSFWLWPFWRNKIDRFIGLLKNKQYIVSIIHWVLYAFLVSNWHVDGKLLIDYVITISSWAQTRNLSDAALPAYHFTVAFSMILVYSEKNLYFLAAAVTIYGTTNIDNFNITNGNILGIMTK